MSRVVLSDTNEICQSCQKAWKLNGVDQPRDHDVIIEDDPALITPEMPQTTYQGSQVGIVQAHVRCFERPCPNNVLGT